MDIGWRRIEAGVLIAEALQKYCKAPPASKPCYQRIDVANINHF